MSTHHGHKRQITVRLERKRRGQGMFRVLILRRGKWVVDYETDNYVYAEHALVLALLYNGVIAPDFAELLY